MYVVRYDAYSFVKFTKGQEPEQVFSLDAATKFKQLRYIFRSFYAWGVTRGTYDEGEEATHAHAYEVVEIAEAKPQPQYEVVRTVT